MPFGSFETPDNANNEETVPANVEAAANFEGNDSLLLVNRLENPEIADRIVEIHYRQKRDKYDYYHNQEWQRHIPDGWTGDEPMQLLKGAKSGEIINKPDLEEILEAKSPPSKAVIKEEFAENLRRIATRTEINYSEAGPDPESISLHWRMPSGEPPTTKQKSIAEAHEKGHQIRDYADSTERLRAGFDISAVELSEEFLQSVKRGRAKPDKEGRTSHEDDNTSLADLADDVLYYYLFTGDEIAERMAQMKNYFGFSGDEKFTKAHLDYAKEHYIEDTGMDNGMEHFFQAITEETEDEFLRLINSYGI